MFRDLANAITEEAFQEYMRQIHILNPAAGKYLQSIDPNIYAMWPIYQNNIQLLNVLTSNDAEQEMMRFKRRNIRNAKSPLHFFMLVVELWKDLIEKCLHTTKIIKRRNHFLTPYAIELLQERIAYANLFKVLF
jgi:hypothetical protein